jgi:hypothetical protein
MTSLAAAPKSGKTWLVVELIHLLKQTKLITDELVFSPTAKFSHDFDAVVPQELQQPFDENKLWHIISRAEKAKQLGHYVHVLVVFDDGLGDNTLQHSAAMEYPVTKGRHANMSAVVISQAANRLLTPTIKASASHVVFGRLNPDAYKVLAKSLFTGTRTESLRPGCTATSARTTCLVFASKVWLACGD